LLTVSQGREQISVSCENPIPQRESLQSLHDGIKAAQAGFYALKSTQKNLKYQDSMKRYEFFPT
jgi:hypothetical protein